MNFKNSYERREKRIRETFKERHNNQQETQPKKMSNPGELKIGMLVSG